MFLNSMDEHNCGTIYDELVEILNQLELGWIAEQVEEILTAGKTVEEMVMGRKSPDLKLAYYSPQEQLSMLIDAIDRTVISGVEMEQEIAALLDNQGLTTDFQSEICWHSTLAQTGEFVKFYQPEILERLAAAEQVRKTLGKLRVNSGKNQPSLLTEIKENLEAIVNPNLRRYQQLRNLFNCYIFNILVTGAKNEGGKVSYKDVTKQATDRLIFRQRPGKIYEQIQPYTHGLIEFANKPPLEIHIGVKVHGRLRVLYDCDICVLYKMEADACRNNGREPRASRILLGVNCEYSASQLQPEVAQAFLSLASELRVAGDCYFVSNSVSEVAGKLLASRKRKWECGIIPGDVNNVHRLMYGFQTIFKDFQAKS